MLHEKLQPHAVSFFKNTYNLKIYKKENRFFSFVAMATRKVRDQRRQVRRHDGYRRTCGYNYKRCQGSDSGGHGAVASSDSHAAPRQCTVRVQ